MEISIGIWARLFGWLRGFFGLPGAVKRTEDKVNQTLEQIAKIHDKLDERKLTLKKYCPNCDQRMLVTDQSTFWWAYECAPCRVRLQVQATSLPK